MRDFNQAIKVYDRIDLTEYERNLSALRDALDEEAFTAAWERGQAMTLDEALAYASEERPIR
jgi:hypothetical protein